MKAPTFVHDHYSAGVGESPTGHAAAILGGLITMAVGTGFVLTVALLPVGIVVSLLGLFRSTANMLCNEEWPAQ